MFGEQRCSTIHSVGSKVLVEGIERCKIQQMSFHTLTSSPTLNFLVLKLGTAMQMWRSHWGNWSFEWEAHLFIWNGKFWRNLTFFCQCWNGNMITNGQLGSSKTPQKTMVQGCTPRPAPGKNGCPGPPCPRKISTPPRPALPRPEKR